MAGLRQPRPRPTVPVGTGGRPNEKELTVGRSGGPARQNNYRPNIGRSGGPAPQSGSGKLTPSCKTDGAGGISRIRYGPADGGFKTPSFVDLGRALPVHVN
jgi:hypothetical protein